MKGGSLESGWLGTLLREWTVVTTINAGTGLPLTPLSRGGKRDRRHRHHPARLHEVPLYSAPAGLFLNPAAYTNPKPGHWGNAGRGSITGPGQF